MIVYIAIVVYAGDVLTAGIYNTHTEAHLAARDLLVRMLAEGGFSESFINAIDDDKGELYRFEVLRTDYRL